MNEELKENVLLKMTQLEGNMISAELHTENEMQLFKVSMALAKLMTRNKMLLAMTMFSLENMISHPDEVSKVMQTVDMPDFNELLKNIK